MQVKLANLVLAYAPLKAMLANNVQWNTMPQGVLGPRIVMTLVSQTDDYSMAGRSALVESRVQFDCRASTAALARQVAEHLDARLSGFRGAFEGFNFQGAFKAGHRTRFDKDGTEAVHTASVDYIIWWKPA